MLNSLSGRFLILTILFVMLAEVLIFVPSVARFRENYLLARLDRAQIASLALLADDMLSPEVEAELLKNAQVYNVVLRRDEIRQLALSSPIPRPVTATIQWQTGPETITTRAIAWCGRVVLVELVDARSQVRGVWLDVEDVIPRDS